MEKIIYTDRWKNYVREHACANDMEDFSRLSRCDSCGKDLRFMGFKVIDGESRLFHGVKVYSSREDHWTLYCSLSCATELRRERYH